MPSIGPGLWPLSDSACWTWRTVPVFMDEALWLPLWLLMPLALERSIDEAVSPAAKAGADASAIQQSAAAIGVRSNFI